MKIEWDAVTGAAGMRPGASRRSVAGELSSLTHVRTEPDAEFNGKMHRHDHEQWLVMIDGDLELEDDGHRYWVRAGDGVIFRRNTWHAAVGVGAAGATYVEFFAPARYDQLPDYVASSPLEWS